MLDLQVMRLIATAFAKVVRERIPYSENISSLFGPYSDSEYFFIRRKAKLKKLRGMPIPTYSERNAIAIWDKGVGWCDELSILMVYFSRYVQIYLNGEKVYITLICTSKHLFCVLHQSKKLHRYAQGEDRHIAEGFDSIAGIFQYPFDNAIIIDVWINKISSIDQIRIEHRLFIKEYHVEQYYEGDILTCGISFELGSGAEIPIPDTMKEIVSRFNYFYFEKLNLETIGDGYQKKFFKVQKKLNLRISDSYLDALRKLIFEITSILSTVYDGLVNSIKVFYIKKALNHIDVYIQTAQFRDVQEIKAICLGILKIAVLVRDRKPPANLNAETLTISRTGHALIQVLIRQDMSTVLKHLDLTEMKDFIFNAGRLMRDRYFALCRYLHVESISSFIKQYGWPTDFSRDFIYIPLLRSHSHNLKNALSDFEHRSTRHYLTCLYVPAYRALCYQELEDTMHL